jgi:hypothetical protein
MRIGAAAVVLLAVTVACASGLFRQYEYEEDLYLSLDGTATLYVNASIDALNALRGTTFDSRPDASFDRQGIEEFFSSPTTAVTRITTSTRDGRRFVHVRLDVRDVRTLGERRPFAWSAYAFDNDGDVIAYAQRVGARATGASSGEGLPGHALVAFRLHAPSRVLYHNAGAENLRRGNILVWEQTLAERLNGSAVEIDVRMEAASILHRTLWLFGASAAAVAATFAVVIWWLTRKGHETRRPRVQKRRPAEIRNARAPGKCALLVASPKADPST